MDSQPKSLLSSSERAHLADLLAVMPTPRRWEVGNMHGALLCVLGLVNPPDTAYANAAQRHFVGSAPTKNERPMLISGKVPPN